MRHRTSETSKRRTQRTRPRFAVATLAALAAAVSCSPSADAPEKATGVAPAPVGAQRAPTGPAARGGMVSRYVVLEGPGAIASLPETIDPGSPAGDARIMQRAAELRAQHAALLPRLRSVGAEIIADLVMVANLVQIRVDVGELSTIAALPGVARLEVPTIVHRSLDVSVPLIGAPALWESGTPLTGQGVRIGVIDTGIDYRHAVFGGAGEGTSFPTAKVVAGIDLAGDDYDAHGLAGSTTPAPDDDPLDCQGHGTHVAAIAAGTGVLADHTPYAGPWTASLDPNEFIISPGVAPEATLYAIKIFGCDGSTELLLPALEWAADPNGDGSTSDRLDVVNASLGSDFDTGGMAEREAIAALTAAGSLFVAAAGNSAGNNRAHFSTDFPGSDASALSVGMTLKTSEKVTRLSLEVTSPSAVAGSYPVGEGVAGGTIADLGTLSGEVVVAAPELACEPLTNGAGMDGKIALVKRGTCQFIDKSAQAAAAGAVGMIIVDNAFNDFPMSAFAPTGSSDIPMWMLRRADGEKLWAAAPLTVTLTDGVTQDIVVGPDYPSLVTGRGPTGEQLLLKPDIVAPGAGIWAALSGSGFDGVANSGTSMSTPAVAGAAALLREALPTLGPLEIKERLVSATRPVNNGVGTPFLSSLVGTGRLQVDQALANTITARVDGIVGEVGVSFGAIRTATPVTESRTVIVSNSGSDAATVDLALRPSTTWPGATLEVDPTSLTVPAGGTATFTLSLSVDPAQLPPSPAYEPFTLPTVILDAGNEYPSVYVTEASGAVTLTRQGSTEATALVAYHGVVQAAAERRVGKVTGCLPGVGEGDITLPLEGTVASSGNAASVLEFGTESSSFSDPTGPGARRDLVAVGALSDPSRKRVHFGVVTAGDWTTPARGWLSEVGIEIDIDGDEVADYLVLAESFVQLEPDKPHKTNFPMPFARVVELSTGEINADYPTLNGALPAYPGGSFFQSDERETYETHLYLNRVLVFPVAFASLGLDASSGAFAYRGVSGVSRLPLVLGLPMVDPVDTTDWVSFDAANPKVTLPDSHYGSPLCPDTDSVTLNVPGELPTLLVLHHANATEPHYETVDLSNLEGSDLSVSAGSGGATTVGETVTTSFEVTNSAGSARVGVVLAVSANGGKISTISASAGSCNADSCDLGTLAPSDTVTVDVSGVPSAEGNFVVTATVTSASACETDTTNDEARSTFTVASGTVDTPADGGTDTADAGTDAAVNPAADAGDGDGGCGCRQATGTNTTGWVAAFALLGMAAWRRRRNRLY